MNELHLIDRLMAKLARHSPLDPADRAALRAVPARLRLLSPHELLVSEGEPPHFCAALNEGFAYRQKSSSRGGRQILALHVPGDALDLQNLYLEIADHSVRALTHAEIAIVSREDLQRVAWERPGVARAIIKDTLIEASILREWLLNTGRRDARARIAHLLCEFAVRLEAAGLAGRGATVLPMSQELLGDALGLTPVHVNRTLRLLENEGLIARDRRDIAFPDWHALQDVADFDPRYLHLTRDEAAVAGAAVASGEAQPEAVGPR